MGKTKLKFSLTENGNNSVIFSKKFLVSLRKRALYRVKRQLKMVETFIFIILFHFYFQCLDRNAQMIWNVLMTKLALGKNVLILVQKIFTFVELMPIVESNFIDQFVPAKTASLEIHKAIVMRVSLTLYF